MKEKGNEPSSSSLVIVSRKMLIAGVAVTALFSFGLGYFLGYGNTGTSRIVGRVEADNRVSPSEERTVLDSSGKPTIAPPVAAPGIIPKEPPLITRRDSEVPPAPIIHQELPKSSDEKKPESGQSLEKKSTGAPEHEVASAARKASANEAEIKSKHSSDSRVGKKQTLGGDMKDKPTPAVEKPEHKPRYPKGKAAYAVQVGAFSEPSNAKRVNDQLAAMGYKASITAFSTASGGTLSRVRMGHYTTKKEAEELALDLKGQGIAGVVVYGNR